MVEDEDAQALEVPVVPRVVRARAEVLERNALPSHVSPAFLAALMSAPLLVRNVAVVGQLHCGKTSLLDVLLEETHTLRTPALRPDGRPARFTDTRVDEQARCVSLKATPLTLACPGSGGKHFALTLLDAPGHVDFGDELAVSLRLADGALLVVDAAEGCGLGTERALAAAAAAGVPVCLLLNKLDRLITELKLPPADAYHKLRAVVDEANGLLASALPAHPPFDPAAGNVAFAATRFGWSFTLASFAALHCGVQAAGAPFEPAALAPRLWGDWYLHPGARALRRQPPPGGGDRTFVSFVLAPLYKLHSACLGEPPERLAACLAPLGVRLPHATLTADSIPLLRAAAKALFGPHSTGLTYMLVAVVPPASQAGAAKAARCWPGDLGGSRDGRAMAACDPRARLIAFVAKLVPALPPAAGGGGGAARFDALVRVMAGTLRVGDTLRVLGEGFAAGVDEEDSGVATVAALWLLQARFRLPLAEAGPGCVVLVGGVDAPVSKTATLVGRAAGQGDEPPPPVFAPLSFGGAAVVRVAVEPLAPADLPKLVAALRCASRCYPQAATRVEESGEHCVFGAGELYLDALLRDVRDHFAGPAPDGGPGLELKVSDPSVRFAEGVSETSAVRCVAAAPNGRSRLTLVAEPLEPAVVAASASGALSTAWPGPRLAAVLGAPPFGWDALAARALWAFGPEEHGGANALLNDTLPGETDARLLAAVRASLVTGFRWGAREGPLCDEPLRGVKAKLQAASLAADPLARGGGQMIPTARRALHAAVLTASPRVLEPLLRVDMRAPADCMAAIYGLLAKRRGHVVADRPVPGTPVIALRAVLPAIESFGFETDLRTATHGAAFSCAVFDSWAVAPGDPLDRSIVLRPLEPSPPASLAREFMVKTRRRKGMSDDVNVASYFDDPLLLAAARVRSKRGKKWRSRMVWTFVLTLKLCRMKACFLQSYERLERLFVAKRRFGSDKKALQHSSALANALIGCFRSGVHERALIGREGVCQQ